MSCCPTDRPERRPAGSRSRLLSVSCFLILSTGIALVAPAGAEDIDRFITSARYPGQDAVVLLNSRTHTFNLFLERHTSMQYRLAAKTEIEHERRIKILRKEGLSRYGDFESRTYNSDIHDYKIEAAVISPEGDRKKVKGGSIKKIKLGKRYFKYRIAFPGLARGSIIEIKEKIESEYPIMSGMWDFSEEVPTLRSQLVFRVPQGTTVLFNSVPDESLRKPDPVEEDKYDVYRVTLENVDPYADEIYMSPENRGNPTLYYHVWMISNEALARSLRVDPGLMGGKPYTMNWNDVTDMLSYYFNQDLWEQADKSAEYREALEDDIAAIKAGGFDFTEEKLNELLAWFRSSFEAVDDDLFYFSSNPEESFENRKGGPYELAYALRYILDQLGVATSVYLVRDADKGLLIRGMPSYAAFTHPILKTDMSGREFWLDPFTHYCRADQLPWQCRGVEALHLTDLGKGNFTTISLRDAEKNRVENMEEASIDSGGNLTANAEVSLTGQHLLELRRIADESGNGSLEDSVREMLGQLFPDTFDEESFEVVESGSDRLLLRYSYSIPGFAGLAGDYMNIDFSDWHSTSLAKVFSTESRRCDLQFPYLEMEHTRVSITLPEGTGVDELPPPSRMSNEYFSYSRNVSANGNEVIFERTLKVLNPTIAVDDYAAAKSFVEEVFRQDSESLVVSR